MSKKLIASLLTALLVSQSAVYAATENQSNLSIKEENRITKDKQGQEDKQIQEDKQVHEGEQIKQDAQILTPEEKPEDLLTLDEAIEKGLKNNLLFKQVENKADIAELVLDNSYNVQNDLNNASSDLSSASSALNAGRDKIYSSAEELADAEEAFNQDKFPVTVTCGTVLALLKDKPEVQVQFKGLMQMVGYNESSVLARAGESIDSFCEGTTSDPVRNMVGKTLSSMGYGKAFIKGALKMQLDQKSEELSSGQQYLESSTQEYLMGEAEYQASLKYALSSVASKLSTTTISSLEARPLGDLIVKMCKKQDELTSYSVDIYRNQVALLIENSYFEALKEQEILKVKEKAEERGKVQYEIAQAAYEVGAKAKDEMNIAKAYYDSTIMNTELQRKAYTEALLELKKNMGVDLKETYTLEPVIPETDETFDLDKGIESGLRRRLETKMAKANEDLYSYLMTAVDDSGYMSSSKQHQEVALLQKQAALVVKGQEAQVETDIRNSYQAVQSTKKLVETAEDLRESAEGTLELAKYKYEAGYAYSNSLLASLNIGQLAGTMAEVIAAEENLANIEEKQIEAMNGYNLAKLKYLNDTGKLIY